MKLQAVLCLFVLVSQGFAAKRTLADLEKDVEVLEDFIAKKKAASAKDDAEKVKAASSTFSEDMSLLKSIEHTNSALDASNAVEPDQELNDDSELLKAIKEGNSKHGSGVADNLELDAMLNAIESPKAAKKEVDIDFLEDKEKCRDMDDKDRCEAFKRQGRCAEQEEKMAERCAMTCGLCCFDKADSRICQSNRDKQGACTSQNKMTRDLMRTHCFKSCGLCFKRAPAVPPCMLAEHGCCWDGATVAKAKVGTPGDGCPACENTNSDLFCRRFRVHCNAGYTNGYDVWRQCPVTCGACNGNCEDHRDEALNCDFYKEQGFCTVKRAEMKFYCKKTCNYCGCRDESVACQQIEYPGECQKYALVVREKCRARCNLC